MPQQASVQAGLNKTYLRANVYDWYGQDDWRALANLTLNFGLRYEYFSPYVEKNNRLVEAINTARTPLMSKGPACGRRRDRRALEWPITPR